MNAVCGSCHTILDASTPSLVVLQQFHARQRYQPAIPLGTRGKIAGGIFEAIGFQVRSIEVDGIEYEWSEYLLYNPYRGYRYLSDYRGHWNVIRPLRQLPVSSFSGSKKTASAGGETYKHFQTAEAQTVFVLGEFPWQVRAGEKVTVEDYIAPPKMLSAEITPNEVAWSQGEYTTGDQIWAAFSLQGSPRAREGIFANQPSPWTGRLGSAWRLFLLFQALLLAVMAGSCVMSRNDRVFHESYSFSSPPQGEPSFVTPVFELKGGESNVEVSVNTNLENDWAYFGFALINESTGQAFDFGKEVEYFSGRDSDGAWTEGGKSGSVTVPGVPAGRYYLRVEPDMDKTSYSRTVRYDLSVRRDVAHFGWHLFAFVLLFLPPAVVTYRVFHFENARWAESDYGSPFGSGSSGGDEDDEEE